MNYELLAQCLWEWGGIALSLGIVAKVIEWDIKIDRAEYLISREEDGI